MSAPKPVYAPIPVRALADQELDGADFKVLGIIAAHDRLNANGSGCYANHKRLAAKIGIHFVTFSKSVTKLGRLGYIDANPHPLNRRLRVYRVIYTGADRELMVSSSDGIVSPEANDTPQPQDGMVSPQANEQPAIVSLGNRQAADNVEQSRVNIFCEAENTFPRREKIHSTEVAPLSSGAALDGQHGSDGAFLAQLGRSIKEGGAVDRKRVLERLEAIAVGEHGDPNTHWAQRLMEELEASQ